ncbi:hypothetical protein, partial [Streptomyces somaliensis]|uniref:hypothetical protein n=1 Tax=Streptomyces somaliensis TaxID=78355 RepID=UPI00263B9DF7
RGPLGPGPARTGRRAAGGAGRTGAARSVRPDRPAPTAAVNPVRGATTGAIGSEDDLQVPKTEGFDEQEAVLQ